MTDQQTQPGDWLAVDGRWYPAHMHPDYKPIPAPVPQPPAPAPEQQESRRALIVTAGVVVVALIGIGIFAAVRSSGAHVTTGTAQEFCDDWASASEQIDDIERSDAESVRQVIDVLTAVRYPEAIAGDATRTIEGWQSVFDAVEGTDVDVDSDAFKSLAQSKIDEEPLTRIDTYSEAVCEF